MLPSAGTITHEPTNSLLSPCLFSSSHPPKPIKGYNNPFNSTHKIRGLLMADLFCQDCQKPTEVVFDHLAGNTICSECGLLLQSHSLPLTSHRSTFANDLSNTDLLDSSSNLLVNDVDLPTVISKSNVGSFDSLFPDTPKLHARSSNPDRSLIHAFDSLSSMADRLGLATSIKDRADEIYKKVEDQKPLKGRNQEAILAACLYIACRQENTARTVKEICSVVSGATKKEIGRAKEFIVKHLEVEMGQSVEMGTIHAGDYLRRFCSNLGMTNHEVIAAQETVQKSEEFDIRRSPISVAAAVIYIITQLSEVKKPLKDISTVTRVAEGTIKNSFKDLYPHLSHIVPNWFANEFEIKSLQP